MLHVYYVFVLLFGILLFSLGNLWGNTGSVQNLPALNVASCRDNGSVAHRPNDESSAGSPLLRFVGVSEK